MKTRSNQIILFGGSNAGSLLNDTWTWTGGDWMQLLPSNSPEARSNLSLSPDLNLGQLILFGGITISGLPADTWTWDGSNWIELTTQTSPSGRSGPSLAFDSSTSQLILFGGTGGGIQNDTWSFLPLPTVTSISPSSGPTSGGTIVTITGIGFIGVSAVNFGLNPATSFIVDSPTQITAISPPGTAGTVDVIVITSNGVSIPSAGSQFTYVTTPIPIFPPNNLKGFQKANRFATQTDYVNILTWKAPSQGNVPVAYRIYRDIQLTELVAVISSSNRLRYEDHNRKKGRTYHYFIVSVDQFGNISTPATVKVKG